LAGSNRRAPAPSRRRASRVASEPNPAGRRRFFDYPRSGYEGLHRWLPSWRFVLGSVLTVGFLGLGAVAAAYYVTEIPDPAEDSTFQASTVYFAPPEGSPEGATGEPIATFAEQKRELVDLTTLPEYVGDAVIASEDRTFWENSGVSPKGIVRALWNNVRGGDTQGASTLTQQYVERYYTDTVTDYAGKAREAILALKITQQQKKEVILGNYLNTIYFGRGAYGIQAAAQKYYGVNAADLTVSQAAMISGIIPNPTNWDPANNPEQAQHRWERSLGNMLEDGHIDKAQHDEAIAAGFPAPIPYVKSDKYAGPTGYLLAMVEKELAGEGIDISEADLTSKGYKVTTTIDPAMQQAAIATIDSLPQESRGDDNPVSPNLRAALVSIDPNDGSIRALYGGDDILQNQ